MSSFFKKLLLTTFAIAGISVIPLLNLQVQTDQPESYITVRFQWANASPQVIESEATSKLEGLLSSMKNVMNISSKSGHGIGSIIVEFKKKTDINKARFEVSNLINQLYAKLPEGVSYPRIYIGEKSIPIMVYSVSANLPPDYIKKFSRRYILPRLSQIEGIQKIEIQGGSSFTYFVEYKVSKMQAHGIKVDDIYNSIQQYVGSEYILFNGNGHLLDGNISFVVKSVSSDSIDWNNIPIKKKEGRIIHLRDVATISYNETPQESYHRINGKNTISLVIYSTNDTNSILLADAIKTEMISVQNEHLNEYIVQITEDETLTLSKQMRDRFNCFFVTLFLLTIVASFRRKLSDSISIIALVLITLCVSNLLFVLLKIGIDVYSLGAMPIASAVILVNYMISIERFQKKQENRNFTVIVIASLVILFALSSIFYLDNNNYQMLLSFTIYIIVTLAVSLLISYYFVHDFFSKKVLTTAASKVAIRSTVTQRLYLRYCEISYRFKWLLVALVIFLFGIPLKLLPLGLDGKTNWDSLYKKIVGNSFFANQVRPQIESILGGTFTLFIKSNLQKSFTIEPSKTALYIRGGMPEGGTVQQLNDVILKVENAISNVSGIEMFRTSIDDSRNGEILIYFRDEEMNNDLPFILKNQLENLLLDYGGVNWSVSGVGRGFSNSISNNFRDESIILEGYNYSKLREYAELLREQLSTDSRVQDAEINSDINGAIESVSEYTAGLDKTKLSLINSNFLALSGYLMDKIHRREINTMLLNSNEAVYIASDVYSKFSIWDFYNSPILIDSIMLKADEMSSLSVEKRGGTISKRNQQYQLAVTYDFIGPFALANSVKEIGVDKIRSVLPLGYTALPNYEYKWNIQDRSQYFAIIIAVILTYVISSIALESLTKSMLVIYSVLISFIGIFISFYLFDINFDQGGVMSFVFTVAIAGGLGTIVIKKFYKRINDMTSCSNFLSQLTAIVFACIGILCSVVPLILVGSETFFWKSFAMGTIGGVTFFMLALILYLPAFLFRSSKKVVHESE